MQTGQLPDKNLLSSILLLILFGWLMSFSSSIGHFSNYAYFFKQSFFIILGLSAGFVLLKTPMTQIKKHSTLLFLLSFFLLLLVFLPAPIGHEVNGSKRWINLVFFKFQPSEMMKLMMILFIAAFLIRQKKDIQKPWIGLFKTIGIISLIGILLLLETDFGATIIISLTALGMLFAAGTYLKQLGIGVAVLMTLVTILILLDPNKQQRLQFWQTDLWRNQSPSVDQSKQAVIGIARGKWSGTGLGAGIQKYIKLPEPHTDMIFAIIGEELGIFGMLLTLLLYAHIMGKGFHIAQTALKNGKKYSSFVALGICTWFSLQISVNIGMNLALIPPKGFTLPLISYGGSSLIFAMLAMALLLRIDMENRASFDKQQHYV